MFKPYRQGVSYGVIAAFVNQLVATEAPSQYAVSFSSGIRRLRHISRFLGVSRVVSPWQARGQNVKISCVVVWGRKGNSRKALRYARARGLPVKYVEDGWIRSCSANAHSRVCYSLLIDDVGVYYDSSSPSSLENMMKLPNDEFGKICGAQQLEYAARCREILVENNITKYNFCRDPEKAQLESDTRPLVLVIDQTYNDASVIYGDMDALRFKAMLERAVVENPDCRVVVRAHPDVVSGRRKGYLQEHAKLMGIEVSACADNPMPWLKKARVVYTGTSQIGYEALLCGCKVKVAGRPFYAGWGLTDDAETINRTQYRRSLDQLFYMTHIYLPKYINPVTGGQWSLEECLDHVCLQKQYFVRNARKHVAIGITPWKRRYISHFLRSPYGSLRFSKKNDYEFDETPLYWSYRDSYNRYSSESKNNSKKVHSKTVRVEDGFVRSIGLGSDYVAPSSLVFDDRGLYFNAKDSSELEVLLNEYRCSRVEIARGRVIRNALCESNISKYNLGVNQVQKPDTYCADQRTKILVIGQVDGDQSLLRGTDQIKTNDQLLLSVKDRNPDAYIVYKPHPDVVSGNRKGAIGRRTAIQCVDETEYSSNLLECLKICTEVHTMTSLSGFEALLRDKRVVTYGMPFYAGWGLTTDILACSRRTTVRTIDELVYICLIKYPYYIHPESGEFVSIETLIDSMNSVRELPKTSYKLWNILKALSYTA